MTMTDEPTPDLNAAIAALTAQLADVRRLALAGAGRVGVAPAIVPSTGLIPDVTDGALIETAWGNAIGGSTGRVLHRFDNLAQLNAQWAAAPAGAQALMLDTFRRYTKRAAGWQPDMAGGSITQTTNAAGYPPVTPHDLGRVPTVVIVQSIPSTNYVYAVTAYTAASFQVNVRVGNTAAVVNAASVQYFWLAF